MIDFLMEYQSKQQSSRESQAMPVMAVEGPGAESKAGPGRRRQGVSAADSSAVKSDDNTPFRVIHKTPEDEEQIRAAVAKNILFNSLDPDQFKIVSDAMEKKEYKEGEFIIRQGEDGDDFYVVQQGVCETYVNTPDGPKMVKKYNRGESFGELALMYNTKRAASIKAATDTVTVWAMDRLTFQRVLMTSSSQKRSKYEQFLERVSVLASLTREERSKVADVLVEKSVKAGEYIITAGDTQDDSFYILMSGSANATKVLEAGQDAITVMSYKPGDYFGELALLTSAPRAANVVASEDASVVSLDRGAFERLLGSCKDILARDKDKYDAVEARLQGK